MIIRNKKRRSYTPISNSLINDKRLTWAARGLLIFLLSKPEDWEVFVSALKRFSPAGECHNRSLIRELEAHGYLRRLQKRNSNGSFGEMYSEVFEEPFGGFPQAVNPPTEKRRQQKKKETNELLNKPAGISGTHERQAEGIGTLYGVSLPPAANSLDEKRLSRIFICNCLSTDQVRLILAEFQAMSERKSLNDPWAVIADLSRKANQGDVRLSLEGEMVLDRFAGLWA